MVKRFPKRFGSRSVVLLAFLLPAMLFYGVIVLYPSVSGSLNAFTDWDGVTQERSFVGLENFRRFFSDERAVAAVRNTVVLAALITVIQNAIGLILALALNHGLRSRNLLRTVFFAPVALTPIVVAYLYQYILSANGPLNQILRFLGLDFLARDWLGNPDVALYTIVAVVVWQFAGVCMVIFLAGLQGIPQELYEAAKIDGANVFQRFSTITFPMLAPAFTISVMFTVTGALKLFDQIYVMTGGGPGFATENLSTTLFDEAFTFGNYGYGTAIALVLTVLMVSVSVALLWVLRRREVEA